MGRVFSTMILISLVSAGVVAGSGEEFIFPVGIFVADNLQEPGWPFDLPDKKLVDLRSRGVEVILLNGIYKYQVGDACKNLEGRVNFDCVMNDVRTLRTELTRADSFGFLADAMPKTFDDALKLYGLNTEDRPPFSYFRTDNPNHDSLWFMEEEFSDSLDKWVSWVVDSLIAFLQQNDVQSLYRYTFWEGFRQ